MITDSLCTFCKVEEETEMHLFCRCTAVSHIWNKLENWTNSTTNFDVHFQDQTILLGIDVTNSKFNGVNANNLSMFRDV